MPQEFCTGAARHAGRIALRVCPELLGILAKDVKTIAITGTNGKTTSARMVEEAFMERKMSYFANRSGANLISGVTTEFVMNCSITGRMKKEYAVIECRRGGSKAGLWPAPAPGHPGDQSFPGSA